MVKELVASKQWIARYEVDSLTGDDESYIVSEKVDGTWACSCPAWKFHKAPKVNCKHILATFLSLNVAKPVVPKKRLVEVFAEKYFDGLIPLTIARENMFKFAEKFAESNGAANVESLSVEAEEVTVGEFKITRKFRLNA